MRFLLLRMLAGLLLFENLVFPSQAATDFPDRPVRILVGFAPGGTTDLLARIVADELRTIWNTAVVVENRPPVRTESSSPPPSITRRRTATRF
jgi:tripartite-type tricarboxylate transporter receptor subunit TctC